MLCLSSGSIKSPENMWNLSDRHHGQGKYRLSFLLTENVHYSKKKKTFTDFCVFQFNSEHNLLLIFKQVKLDWVFNRLLSFARLFFTRIKTSRVGVMSAVMTAWTFIHTSAAATPFGWKVAALWSTNDPTSWVTNTSWGGGSTLTTRDGWASAVVFAHVGWFQL